MGLLFLILSKLASDPSVSASEAIEVDPSSPRRQAAPVIAGLMVLLIVGAVSQLALSSTQQLPAQASRAVPRIPGWELTSPLAVWLADQQNHTATLALTYQRDRQNLHIVITETTTPDAKLQESGLVPGDGNDWHQNKVEKHSPCIALKCLTLQHTTWQSSKTEELRHVYAAYALGQFTTTSKLALRVAQGWDRLSAGAQRARLIGFTLDAAASTATLDELAGAFQLLQFESGDKIQNVPDSRFEALVRLSIAQTSNVYLPTVLTEKTKVALPVPLVTPLRVGVATVRSLPELVIMRAAVRSAPESVKSNI
jgi:hypothetical protein